MIVKEQNSNNSSGSSNNNTCNETIVTLRLPSARYYKAAWLISQLLRYDSLDDFVSDVVKGRIESELDGAGELDLDTINHDLKEKLLA